MKKIIFSMLAAMMSLAAMAQSDIWYWKNGEATKLQEVDSITFAKPAPPVVKPEYVDLGLSVKWANMNVGANAPTEYGDYFAWGETTPKTYYSWDTYKYGTSPSNITKYNDADGKTVLDAEDDAATANWGGAWRMPTIDEMKELLSDCTWEWHGKYGTEFDGASGYKVTSKKEGYTDKYIFLPAAGDREGYVLGSVAYGGSYWSATRDTDGADSAYLLEFSSRPSGNYHNWNGALREYGFSVRPVCP